MSKFLCGECIHNSDKGGGCLIPKNLGYVDNCNRYLPKDKPIVQTNEEYIKSCNTEQLAEWIHTAIFDDNFANKIADEAYMNMQTRNDYIEMWLKQPHKESE